MTRTADQADRVTGLCPFVHVADIEKSIAFYESLGSRWE
jgi:hypothetical protein